MVDDEAVTFHQRADREFARRKTASGVRGENASKKKSASPNRHWLHSKEQETNIIEDRQSTTDRRYNMMIDDDNENNDDER